MHTGPCVSPIRMVSVSPTAVESLPSIPTAFKARCSWGCSSHCQTARLESLTWGSVLHSCGRTSVIQLFSIVGRPPDGFGIWFHSNCSPLPSCCDFSFVSGRGVSFLVGSNIYGTSTISCDFNAFTGGGECTYFLSTILNQSSLAMLFNDFFIML